MAKDLHAADEKLEEADDARNKQASGLAPKPVMAFLRAAGPGLEVERIAGAAPVLVFLHEGLGCVGRWRDFPAAVAATTGCAALVYSRRGYGRSEPAELPRPLTFMHDEALRILPDLLADEGIDDAILIGHSDGASIALIYAGAVRRGVRGLVVIAPHVFVEEVCLRSIAALRADYGDSETLLRQKLAKHHTDVDHTFLGWAEVWLDPGFRAWNLTGYLPEVSVPVLVIQGEDDGYGTLAQVDAVCAGVSGPCERVVLAACGHVPPRDRPEATLEAIVRFVKMLGS
jgi:pimeloyl-ACP methyl ester carboxylesterase